KKKSTSKLNQSKNLKSHEITQTDSSMNEEDEYDNQDDNSLKVLCYNLDEMQEVITKIIEEAEAQNKSIKFVYEIEIDQDILSTISLTKLDLDSNDLKTIENRFLQLAYTFIMPLELESGYYWEKKIDSQLPKRVSEARAPIERYACLDNIKLTIIPEEQYILVQRHHNVVHTKPTYWQIEFPIEARKWIQNNVSFNIRYHNSVEVNFSLSVLQDKLVVNHNIMRKRREKYTYYKKKFNAALELYQQEMDNDNFIKNFNALMVSLLKEIEKCKAVLQVYK
ncbi:21499_t:CDS:2, partial [Cetraspora pellucida]